MVWLWGQSRVEWGETTRNDNEQQFPSTSPRGGLYWEGRFNGGFFALRVWGGGAFIWRGLFLEFYGNYPAG